MASLSRTLAQWVVGLKYDDLPEAAFYMVGTIEEVVQKAEKMAKDAVA